ncbi:MAG: hypothetical protein M1838_001520 [Thelocarpon superellum]|nr:MAG: hypothetical protein M1838_001520 [Thelocarpon superellum]
MDSAKDFLSFVNASPTPFHAVDSARKQLIDADFQEIRERDPWSQVVQPGGKYYLTRNGSSIVAFAVGKKWKAGNPIAMIGAHTDSPCLRIKPVSKKQNDGFLQVGVETYGGGLWHTWFDRDLSIAGRVMAKTSEGAFLQKLVKVDKPILRVPTLAIHLQRQDTFEFNKETQLFPIAGLMAAELNRAGPSADSKAREAEATPDASFRPLKALTERHHPRLLEIVAAEAGVAPGDIADFELVLYDTQRSCIGGLNDELIFSARLDNLMMSFCAVHGLIDSVESSSALDDEPSIRLISLFDHEEIGSRSAQGADSNLLPGVIRRLSVLSPPPAAKSKSSAPAAKEDISTAYEQTLSSSFLVSADMAHSVHPNYGAKYESDHRPEMNKGVVIKINANVRYATNSPGIVLLEEVARRARSTRPSSTSGTPTSSSSSSSSPSATGTGVPLQLFVVRNDASCGSTIGPMLSAALGTRTLDLGNAQLSMHSIRETGGVYDVEHAINLFESYFRHFAALEAKILVDS